MRKKKRRKEAGKGEKGRTRKIIITKEKRIVKRKINKEIICKIIERKGSP